MSGLIQAGILSGLGDMAKAAYAADVSAETAQAKARADLQKTLLEQQLKNQGAMGVEEAKKLPLDMSNPRVQQAIALNTGMSTPDVKGVVDSLGSPDLISPKNAKLMGNLYKNVSAAYAQLNPGQASAAKSLEEARGAKIGNDLDTITLNGGVPLGVRQRYESARRGLAPYSVDGGVLFNRNTGDVGQLPEVPGGKVAAENIRTANSLIDLVRNNDTYIRQYEKTLADRSVRDQSIRQDAKDKIQALRAENAGYKGQINLLLGSGQGTTTSTGRQRGNVTGFLGQ
ncbi:hypothetical protein DFO50_10977 [Microvirgula sp. AG722]|uniref:hypothetical protein n=1 Tax=Microvirgula sp. AG722 TaxID=2183901 RepID=UPI000DC5EB8E|nr:hypothetical protein [Microvirgula sp. AG722]RAS14822.1 hypothetical protein DFO50_10977 [Microvirgula sp. AG722]